MKSSTFHCTGGAISSASNKSVLPVVVSMVLAIFLLVFCSILRKSFVLFLDRVDSLKLGGDKGAQDVQERYVEVFYFFVPKNSERNCLNSFFLHFLNF